MKSKDIHRIQKPKDNHRVERPKQTGFSSPATHYNEPRIDLNAVLVNNIESTFYIRVRDDSFIDFNICKNDVLIVDKSMEPKNNQLILSTNDQGFQIINMPSQGQGPIKIWGVITYIIKSVS